MQACWQKGIGFNCAVKGLHFKKTMIGYYIPSLFINYYFTTLERNNPKPYFYYFMQAKLL
jgi:hypothetical protein